MIEKSRGIYLRQEEREDARTVTKKIWAESMRRLGGKESIVNSNPQDQLYGRKIIIWGYPFYDFNDGLLDSDLTIYVESKPSLSKKVYCFNRGLGGHVMTKMIDSSYKTIIENEAGKDELWKLFESITGKEEAWPVTEDDVTARKLLGNLVK